MDAAWTPDGTAVLLGVRRGADSTAVVKLDLASGRSVPVATFAREELGSLIPIPGGGLLLLAGSQRDLRRVGATGLADSTFHPPPGIWAFLHVDPSPDGREFVSAAWTTAWDSILVHRISLTDGSVTRLAGFAEGEGVVGARWLADGSILVQILETSWTLGWYVVPAAGGPAVRVGTAPRFPARYDFAVRDSRRVLAEVQDFRTDVYLVPGFAELLKR